MLPVASLRNFAYFTIPFHAGLQFFISCYAIIMLTFQIRSSYTWPSEIPLLFRNGLLDAQRCPVYVAYFM